MIDWIRIGVVQLNLLNAQVPSLFCVREMHLENGPPLPLGEQLRRLSQLQSEQTIIMNREQRTPFLCVLTEAIVSPEHRRRGIEVAPQPEHCLRGEKCERVKKYAPQPLVRCSLQHGAPVEEQTCFLVGNNFLAIPISLLFTILP